MEATEVVASDAVPKEDAVMINAVHAKAAHTAVFDVWGADDLAVAAEAVVQLWLGPPYAIALDVKVAEYLVRVARIGEHRHQGVVDTAEDEKDVSEPQGPVRRLQHEHAGELHP